jgi:hypothetical protein
VRVPLRSMASIADTKPLLRRAGLEPVISAFTIYERFFKTGSVDDVHSLSFTSSLDHHTPSPMPRTEAIFAANKRVKVSKNRGKWHRKQLFRNVVHIMIPFDARFQPA